MISVNAFNALLKTLEEPPPHVVFILATTEPHKIPLTIISRCQRFDFKSISNKAIIGRLREIMEFENIPISNEALEAIALAAEGGMRDALSILDQTISYSDGEIDVDDVLAVTGGVSQNILTEIATAMYERDTERTLLLFDSLIENGKDPSRFVFDFIYFLRDILFYKTNPRLEEYLERAIVTDEFIQLTETVDVDWIQYAIEQFTECEQQIKWTTSPKVFVEITLLTVANRFSQQEEQAVSSNELIQLTNRIAELEKKLTELQNVPTSGGTTNTVKRQDTNRVRKRTFETNKCTGTCNDSK